MRWVVTGGSGNLGDALNTAPGCDTKDWLFKHKGVLDVTWSAERLAAVLEVWKAEGVINLAACTDVSLCEMNPKLAREVNTEGAANMANACAILDIPMIHVSTDYVFGGGVAPYGVGATLCPTNVYGATKAAAEYRVRDVGGVVVRMSFLPDPPGYAWVADGVRCTKEWVDSAARRLAAFVMLGMFVSGEVYNLVPERETTLSDLVRSRYGLLPVKPLEQVVEVLPYTLPVDVRLCEVWGGTG